MQTPLNPFPGRRRSIAAAPKKIKPASEPAVFLPAKRTWKCDKCGRTLKQGIARHMRNCKG